MKAKLIFDIDGDPEALHQLDVTLRDLGLDQRGMLSVDVLKALREHVDDELAITVHSRVCIEHIPGEHRLTVLKRELRMMTDGDTRTAISKIYYGSPPPAHEIVSHENHGDMDVYYLVETSDTRVMAGVPLKGALTRGDVLMRLGLEGWHTDVFVPATKP